MFDLEDVGDVAAGVFLYCLTLLVVVMGCGLSVLAWSVIAWPFAAFVTVLVGSLAMVFVCGLVKEGTRLVKEGMGW